MRVLAIDPGDIKSAYIIFDTVLKKVVQKNWIENDNFIVEINKLDFDQIAIEKIVSMGMPVGDTTFQTVFMNGRLYQNFTDRGKIPKFYSRLDIKVHLCNTTRAKDGNVRQALVNRFSESSTKKNPHDIFNELTDKIYFGSHFWSCLAIAIYHIEPHHSRPIQFDNWGTYKEPQPINKEKL